MVKIDKFDEKLSICHSFFGHLKNNIGVSPEVLSTHIKPFT